MKCKNCGKEITITDLKCPYCKAPVELELGDEFLDDDILSDVITSDIADSLRKNAESDKEAKEDKDADHKKDNTSRKDSSKKRIVVIVIAIVLIGIALYLLFHSAFYYLFRGRKSYEKTNYEKSMSFYEKAYEKDDRSLKALVGMADNERCLGLYEDAIMRYKEALSLDSSDRDCYVGLIACYTAIDDEENLEILKASAPSSVSDVFEQYMVLKPVFTVDETLYSEASNSYKDDLTVVLTSPEGNDIYFSFDGTDPNAENGNLYTNPLLLTQGTTEIRAVCVNQYGISSAVASVQYKIDYAKPDNLVISPESGLFEELTYVNIVVPEGCHVFYTWDGSTPTSASAEYTAPIPVIEGNNILSVIVVNEHGLASDVFRYNYSYMPDDN